MREDVAGSAIATSSLPSSCSRSGAPSVPPDDGAGHRAMCGAVDGELAQVDELQADLCASAADELGLGEDALVDEDPAEAAARPLGAPRRQPRAGPQLTSPSCEQDVAELLHSYALHLRGFLREVSRRLRCLALDRPVDGCLECPGAQKHVTHRRECWPRLESAHSRVINPQFVSGAIGEAEIDATPDAEGLGVLRPGDDRATEGVETTVGPRSA